MLQAVAVVQAVLVLRAWYLLLQHRHQDLVDLQYPSPIGTIQHTLGAVAEVTKMEPLV
jgi:hypothetical protein